MNLSKSMETIFVSALIVIGATAGASAAVPKLFAPKVKMTVVQQGEMTTVILTAKRPKSHAG